MRICLIATELPGFGPYGGFGVLTHDIAVGLAARGVDVYVVMPRNDGQNPVETIGKVKVLSYPSPLYAGLKKVLRYEGVYRLIDADVYHSEEPSLGTALAQRAMPHKQHLVTFQDPRDLDDWRVEWAHRRLTDDEILKFWTQYLRQSGRAASLADATYCQARCIIPKVKQMYGLTDTPGVLPNPIKISQVLGPKAATPTVCCIGRWDPRKRPELFFDLAARFPSVRFIAVGACLNDPDRDAELRKRCKAMQNVEAPGWLSAENRSKVLESSWILVNTSTRECLPVSYVEACAYRCAILSHCNADEFASNFGVWVKGGELCEYEKGLAFLLSGNRWEDLGRAAHESVLKSHECDRVIDAHMDVYEQALKRGGPKNSQTILPHLWRQMLFKAKRRYLRAHI